MTSVHTYIRYILTQFFLAVICGVLAACVIGVICFIIVICGIRICIRKRRSKSSIEEGPIDKSTNGDSAMTLSVPTPSEESSNTDTDKVDYEWNCIFFI